MTCNKRPTIIAPFSGVSHGFHKLADDVRWAVLRGTEGGQHTRGSA